MPVFVSPLDGNYISLKRAALLIAREQPDIESGDIMDMFTHALFAGEFEREEVTVRGMEPIDDWNLPLLRIEAPRNGTAIRLPLDQQPQEYFAVKRVTIAEVLSERDALPGKAENWVALAESPHDKEGMDKALHDLARIPYAAFPVKAHDILGGILLAKIKLRLWMAFKGYELPSFLRNIALSGQTVSPVTSAEPETEEPDVMRGRPRKTAWIRIRQLICDRHAAQPKLSRYVLAHDAYETAKTEFREKDLPSLETIIRQMKNILATRG
jgi:hypothetical protein